MLFQLIPIEDERSSRETSKLTTFQAKLVLFPADYYPRRTDSNLSTTHFTPHESNFVSTGLTENVGFYENSMWKI